MKVITGEVLTDAVFSNKNDFFQFSGHVPGLIQDPRLSRVGWLSVSTDLNAEMYGEGMYGMSLYGAVVLADNLIVLNFDAGKTVTFDTLGVVNHNLVNLDVTVRWGADSSVAGGVAHVGPEAVTSDGVYRALGVSGSGRYIQVEFRNPTSGGILKIGRLMLGVSLQLPGVRTVYDSGLASSSLAAFSDTRQMYGTRKTTWRKLGFEFAPGDNRAVLHGLMRTLDRSTATLWTFDEPCMTEEVLYAHIENSEMALTHDEARLYSGRITISEVK